MSSVLAKIEEMRIRNRFREMSEIEFDISMFKSTGTATIYLYLLTKTKIAKLLSEGWCLL